MKKQPLIKEAEHILQSKFDIDIKIVKLKGTQENKTYVEFLYYNFKHHVTISIPRYEIQPTQVASNILELITDQHKLISQALIEEDYLYN